MKKPLRKVIRNFLFLFLLSFVILFSFAVALTAYRGADPSITSPNFFSGFIDTIVNQIWPDIYANLINFLTNPLVLIVLIALLIWTIVWYAVNIGKNAKFISYILPLPFALVVVMGLLTFMYKDPLIARVLGNWPDPLSSAADPATNLTAQAITIFTLVFLALTIIFGLTAGLVGFIGTVAAPSKIKQREQELLKKEKEAEAARLAAAEEANQVQSEEEAEAEKEAKANIYKDEKSTTNTNSMGTQNISGSPITININNNFPPLAGAYATPVTTIEEKKEEPIKDEVVEPIVEQVEEEQPVEVIEEEKPVEVVEEQKPAEVVEEEKPVQAVVEEKPVEEVPAPKPIVESAEKVQPIVEEVKPVVVVEEKKPVEVVQEEKPIEPVIVPVSEVAVDEEDEKDGEVKPVIRRIPFAERIPELEDDVKAKYSELKNYCLAYGIKSRISNSGDTFRLHRKTYVKITVAGKGLKLYFALNPKDYEDSTIPVKDVSNKNIYAEIPAMFKVKSVLSFKRAKQLIDDVCQADGLVQGDIDDYDWSQDFTQSSEDDD